MDLADLLLLFFICGGVLLLAYVARWLMYRTAAKREGAWRECASRLRGRCENRPRMLANPGYDMVLSAEIDGIDVEAHVETRDSDEYRPAETVVQAWFQAIATKPSRGGVGSVMAPGYAFQRQGDKIVGRRSGIEENASQLEAALRAAAAWVLSGGRP